jgi:hypothetical protein
MITVGREIMILVSIILDKDGTSGKPQEEEEEEEEEEEGDC